VYSFTPEIITVTVVVVNSDYQRNAILLPNSWVSCICFPREIPG